MNFLFDFWKRRRLRRRRCGSDWPATLCDPLLERIDLIGFQAAQLVLDVVTKVAAIVQDRLGFETKGFGQFEDADFLESLCRQKRYSFGAFPTPRLLIFGGKWKG